MKDCAHKTESGYCTAFERECDADTCNPYCCEYEPSDVCSRCGVKAPAIRIHLGMCPQCHSDYDRAMKLSNERK